jgi:hypothetical protein
MAQSLEEMNAFFAQQKAGASEARKQQLGQQAQVGKVISELLADPKWEMYARHVESLREAAAMRADAAQKRVMDSCSQEMLITGRVAHAKAKAEADTYAICLNLVESLVKTGQLALEQINA